MSTEDKSAAGGKAAPGVKRKTVIKKVIVKKRKKDTSAEATKDAPQSDKKTTVLKKRKRVDDGAKEAVKRQKKDAAKSGDKDDAKDAKPDVKKLMEEQVQHQQRVSSVVFDHPNMYPLKWTASDGDADSHPLQKMTRSEAAAFIQRNLLRAAEYTYLDMSEEKRKTMQLSEQIKEDGDEQMKEFRQFLQCFMEGVAEPLVVPKPQTSSPSTS